MTIPGFGRLTPSQKYMVELTGTPLPSRYGYDRSAPPPTDEQRVVAMRHGRAELRQMTGEDFGYDLAAWRTFLTGGDFGFTHPYGAEAAEETIDEALVNPDRPRLVAMAEAEDKVQQSGS
jgi:hypothetical protein